MEAIAAIFMCDDEIDDEWGFHPIGVVHVEEDGTYEKSPEVWTIDQGSLAVEQTRGARDLLA